MSAAGIIRMRTTSIKPGNENDSAEQMVAEPREDQALIQKTLQAALEAAQTESDEVVAGFVIERLTVHRKAAWMLKSSI